MKCPVQLTQDPPVDPIQLILQYLFSQYNQGLMGERQQHQEVTTAHTSQKAASDWERPFRGCQAASASHQCPKKTMNLTSKVKEVIYLVHCQNDYGPDTIKSRRRPARERGIKREEKNEQSQWRQHACLV
jgi:hypothetical protein